MQKKKKKKQKRNLRAFQGSESRESDVKFHEIICGKDFDYARS